MNSDNDPVLYNAIGETSDKIYVARRRRRQSTIPTVTASGARRAGSWRAATGAVGSGW